MTVSPIPTDLQLPRSQEHLTRDPRYRPYQPYGGSEELFYAKDQEVLICGPAGTGKSRGALEKIHLCCSKYPGMRALLIRKTRESLTQSAVVTFENFVIPDNGSVRFRTAEQEYRYSNGSKVVLGGMDKASKVLSSEYDLIYVMEATELTLEDWETLTTRARFGIMPYNQVIADCNPVSPKHWLKTRSDAQSIRYISSLHKDNPRLYDHDKKEWTPRGIEYIKKLSALTGVRRKRLYEGVWAAAEGMIYEEEWNDNIHIISNKSIPRDWTRIWVVDFGFTNPFCWQAWALDEDGRAYRYAEIYHTRLLVEDAAALITSWRLREQEPYPSTVICDWDAEGRATLERHLGVDTFPADKRILEGIENVKARLRIAGDGKPRLFFMRDSLFEVDEDLREAGLPTVTEQEFDGYEWNDRVRKEIPVDKDNHGMDCTRYLCNYLTGELDGWSRGAGR